ncbi:hypothetical protein D8L93_01295 [Sodalis-like symbiont of Bactericera trigonica]|nr:hypothetical protein D8L93_01295 [Sodalis-like symbiont of Bactericera trigonica]
MGRLILSDPLLWCLLLLLTLLFGMPHMTRFFAAYREVIYLILTGIGGIWREFVVFLRFRNDLYI